MSSVNNLTKMKVRRPANEVFEAFVDPAKIGKFWFSSSSARWEPGKTITLRYDEYDAQGDMRVTDIQENRRIAFRWGDNDVTITLKELDGASTVVEVNEDGFDENDERLVENLVANKEGWVYTLTCLKGYLEYGADLRASLVK